MSTVIEIDSDNEYSGSTSIDLIEIEDSPVKKAAPITLPRVNEAAPTSKQSDLPIIDCAQFYGPSKRRSSFSTREETSVDDIENSFYSVMRRLSENRATSPTNRSIVPDTPSSSRSNRSMPLQRTTSSPLPTTTPKSRPLLDDSLSGLLSSPSSAENSKFSRTATRSFSDLITAPPIMDYASLSVRTPPSKNIDSMVDELLKEARKSAKKTANPAAKSAKLATKSTGPSVRPKLSSVDLNKISSTPARSGKKSIASANSSSSASQMRTLQNTSTAPPAEPDTAPTAPRIIKKSKTKDSSSTGREYNARMAELNKANPTKKDFAKEMIVEFEASFQNSEMFRNLSDILTPLGAEVRLGSWTQPASCIKWFRALEAEYNPDKNLFVPAPKKIVQEPLILRVMSGKDFIDLMKSNQIAAYLHKLSSEFQGYTITVLTVALNKACRAERAAVDRAIRNQVSKAIQGSTSTDTLNAPMLFNEKSVTNCIIESIISHDTHFMQVNNEDEAAETLSSFTQDIGYLRYVRHLTDLKAEFESSSLQIRSAQTSEESLSIMLKEVRRMTPNVAASLSASFSHSALSLHSECIQKGAGLLTNMMGLNDRRIGASLSASIHKIFTCTDPNATIC
ncbi:hypothetical protein CANCADRAFT_106581 [Tortispora caseinolytica NRRL Y-17796]|uniref:Uncharacterized protein n=1 Tax=Tortispora caseinolytica NRRL Y-17796 TaxID=767744 RepID=A0A1E4TF90_9ASCO|nr:hypothetical protein CANCADRAFT_106581 [Tortispora caseinolytica NRRL Y-17796]